MKIRPTNTISVAPVTIDIRPQPTGNLSASGGKLPATFDVSPGGGAINVGEAILAASGRPPTVVAITGADVTGNMASQLLQQQFRKVRRAAAATRTRLSVIVPPLDDGGERLFTSRPGLDHDTVFNTVQPLLKCDQRLVLSSLRPEDARLMERLINAHSGSTVWLPSSAECGVPETSIPLMAKCTLVWLNAEELEALTGFRNATGINRLREQGVRDIVVTDGPRGVTAYIEGRFWFHRAFQSTGTNGSTKCGDIACGTFLAAQDRGLPVDGAIRLAMAAAAMHRSGISRRGWSSIESWAQSADVIRYVQPSIRRGDQQRLTDIVRHPATMAATLFGIGMLIGQNLTWT